MGKLNMYNMHINAVHTVHCTVHRVRYKGTGWLRLNKIYYSVGGFNELINITLGDNIGYISYDLFISFPTLSML